MFKTRISESIDRSQQDVFDYVSDPANDTNWQGSTESSQWTSDGPHGVGSTQSSVIKFLGRKIDSTVEITAWDPPDTLAFKTVKSPIPFQVVLGFEPRGENATEIIADIEAEFGGFFKVAEGLVGKQLVKEMNTSFSALKLILEAEQG